MVRSLSLLLAAGLCFGVVLAAPAEVSQGFAAAVTVPVRLAASAEGPLAVYELHLTNFALEPLTLHELRVLDPATGAPVASFDAAQVAARCTVMPVQRRPQPCGPVASGQRVLVYLEFAFASGRVPARLVHEIRYSAPDGPTRLITAAPAQVAPHAAEPLGPPVAGGPWVAVHHPDWPRGHRRMAFAVDGAMRVPGRFAIDFIRVGPEGQTTHGAPDRPADAVGYGDDVLAVADAIVAAARDDLDESPSIAANPAHALGDATGNYVVLRLADARFVFYEHLRRGSVRVKAGARVRRGQVLGALGFSGDTTGPHLHFHVADAISPLGSEGVPFAFARYRLLGQYADIGALGSRRWTSLPSGTPAERRAEWPGYNVVLEFAP